MVDARNQQERQIAYYWPCNNKLNKKYARHRLQIIYCINALCKECHQ
jgi:hypothetical protein